MVNPLLTVKPELVEELERYLNDAINTLPYPVNKRIEDFMLRSKGKMLRPILVVMTASILAGEDPECMENAYRSACATELLHNMTLLHDDLIDGAPKRRGQPAYHIRHGMERAVHDGDLLHAHALTLVKDHASLNLIVHVSELVGIGNAYELEDRLDNVFDFTLERVLEIMRLKTAVVFAGCVELGCIAAKRHHDVWSEKLKEAIINAGIAFQIQDDLLDIIGDPEVFGKEHSWDIQESKRNLFLYFALRRKEHVDELKRIYSIPVGEKTKKDVEFVHSVFNEVVDDVIKVREEHLERALKALEELEQAAADERARDLFEFLKELTIFLCRREK